MNVRVDGATHRLVRRGSARQEQLRIHEGRRFEGFDAVSGREKSKEEGGRAKEQRAASGRNGRARWLGKKMEGDKTRRDETRQTHRRRGQAAAAALGWLVLRLSRHGSGQRLVLFFRAVRYWGTRILFCQKPPEAYLSSRPPRPAYDGRHVQQPWASLVL